ncbi:MAG: polysaccharide deacetylase family protein [Elusimicrobiota bacterium]
MRRKAHKIFKKKRRYGPLLKAAAALAAVAVLVVLGVRRLGEGESPEALLARANGGLYTPAYLRLRGELSRKYRGVPPGRFGEAVKGVTRRLPKEAGRVIAITLDACGGEHSGGYNDRLINFLRGEGVPATLFISGRWIDRHPAAFLELAREPDLEIESHGYLHRACSVSGRGKWTVKGTRNAAEAVDEIELNARKIAALTGRRPRFHRPGGAYSDEACAALAKDLGLEVLTYDIYSGDARPHAPDSAIAANLLKYASPGGIFILHFNHPGWNEEAALRKAIPALKARGYSFVRLDAAIKPR